MATVAIIPARGASKGLPNKHLRLLGGEPMIVHTIRAALQARQVARVLVSTDDPRIARVARRAGAEAPFLRPAELAADDTPTLAAIQHAVAWLESAGQRVDVVVTLQPTSPLRGAAEIEAVLGAMERAGADSAVSVAPLGLPASVIGWLDAGRFVSAAGGALDVRRQAMPPAARITGGVYATRRALLRSGRLLDDRPAAHLVAAATAVDVDTLADLSAARRAWRASRASGAPRVRSGR
jgi:CMP-N-acetylneuraminic acid synthetase